MVKSAQNNPLVTNSQFYFPLAISSKTSEEQYGKQGEMGPISLFSGSER